jgi:hypothetical protein
MYYNCTDVVLPCSITVERVGMVLHVCFEVVTRLVYQGTVVGTACGDGGNPI